MKALLKPWVCGTEQMRMRGWVDETVKWLRSGMVYLPNQPIQWKTNQACMFMKRVIPWDTSSTKHACLEEECTGNVTCNSHLSKEVLEFGCCFFSSPFEPPLQSWPSF